MKFKKAVVIGITPDVQLEQKYFDQIDKLVDTTVFVARDDPKLFDELKEADVLLSGFRIPIGKDIIDAAPNLKLVNILATAYGTVDLESATARDIAVCNLGSYSTEAVAEFTIAAFLHELRGLAEGLRRTAADNYDFTGIPARELKGSNFAVVGLGSIGNRVAELAAGFGANVSYWSRHKKDVPFTYVENLDDLLAGNDIISINVAETDDTKNFLHAKNLPLIPSGSIVISTVPPTVFDADALAERLAKNDMVFIDTIPGTELPEELVKIKPYPNAILYPMIAFATREANTAKQETFVANLQGFLGGNVERRVN